MADTPQQRTDDPGEGTGTTPPAPQGRTDQEQDADDDHQEDDAEEAERRGDSGRRSTDEGTDTGG